MRDVGAVKPDSIHHFFSQDHCGFPVSRLLTDFVCLLIYEFWISLWKIALCSVILLLPLFIFSCKYQSMKRKKNFTEIFVKNKKGCLQSKASFIPFILCKAASLFSFLFGVGGSFQKRYSTDHRLVQKDKLIDLFDLWSSRSLFFL